jgi:Zn finger protein HypA/HybF involved in hydrogenase expression
MHDSFLMQNIIKSIRDICVDNKFARVKDIELMVNWDSHITQTHLTEHLIELCDGYVDTNTKVVLIYGEVPELTAKIDYIEGEESN